MAEAGDRVRARPFGWDEDYDTWTGDQLLDWDEFDNSTDPVEGTLEIVEAEADADLGVPGRSVYLVGQTVVDPKTIEVI